MLINHPLQTKLRLEADHFKYGAGVRVAVFQGQIVPHRDALEPDRLLPCHGDAEPRALVYFESVDQGAVEPDIPRLRAIFIAPHDEVCKSAFACPVRAEEGMDLTRFNVYRKPGEERDRAFRPDTVNDIFEFKKRHGGSPESRNRFFF